MLNQKEFDRYRRMLLNEYRSKLHALRLLHTGGRPALTRAGGVQSRVLAAINKLSGPFTVADVLQAIRTENPFDAAAVRRNALSIALLRLARKNVLTVLNQGSGRAPTTYKRNTTETASRRSKRSDRKRPAFT